MNKSSNTAAQLFQSKNTAGQIIIYCILIICILFLFFHFTTINHKRILKQNAVYAEDVARQTADRISDQFENATALIKAYAYFLEITGEDSITSSQFLKELEASSPFDGLRFTGNNGTIHSSSSGSRNVMDRDFYKRGMQGKSGISVVLFSRIYHQTVVNFYTPVRFKGTIVGVLQGTYLADSYLRSLLATSFFGEQADTFLCMPDGWIVASSTGKKYSETVFAALKQDGLLTQELLPEAERLFHQGNGTLASDLANGASNISIITIPHQNLILVQAFPGAITNEMTAQANKSGIELEIWLVSLFICHGLFMFWRSHVQKKKLLKENWEKGQVVSATNAMFAARYVLCDLEKETYKYIAGSVPCNASLPKEGTYSEMVDFQTNLLIDQQDRSHFSQYFSKDSVTSLLKNTDFLVYECHVNRNGKDEWENFNAICVERKDDVPVKILFLRQNVSEKKKRELGLQKKLSAMDRKERQYSLAVTSSALFNYEFNVSRNLLDKDVIAHDDGETYSLLEMLNLKAPCPATDVFLKTLNMVQEESREAFAPLLSMEYLRQRYEAGQKELDFEYWISMLDGSERCRRMSLYMTRDDFTSDIMAMLVCRDITAHVIKQRQQTKTLESALLQARHANEAKTTFLSNMSHDIRTPMNAIIGFTTMALTHLDNQEQARDALGKVLSSSNHLLSLINDILDMSRIESGKLQIKEQECNISELMHNLVNIIQPQVKAKQLQLFIDTYEVTNEDVMADALKLNQIFINLLGNAVKYTPAGGNITFRISQSQAYRHGYADFIFEVRDNGIGMSEEFVKHIFEPFTRESTTTISGIQGTGLGMAITKNIVDLMNGEIIVESTLGQGSAFIVKLSFKLANREVNNKALAKLKGIRALVVDDDFNVCDSVDKMLRQLGLRSEWTTSGREAAHRAKIAFNDKDPYNTFIIDWHMPMQNGVETTRQIRKYVGTDTPIIILTAYDWADIEEEAKEAGVTAFCAKPLFMSDLRNALLSSHKLLEKEAEPKGSIDFGQKRILLVDDLELNREVAEFILTESGFQVEMAPDGTDAVDMVSKSPEGYYDAILMDVQMPIMNGYEATRAIRNMNRKDVKDLPIIAMTANALEEDKVAALKSGMNAHIAKPIDIKKFMEVMKEYFAHSFKD